MPHVVRTLKVAAALALGYVTNGCSDPLDAAEPTQAASYAEGLSGSALTDVEAESLAREYMFKLTTAGETASVFARIRGLDAREARLFHDHVGKLNGYTGIERRMFDAGFEYALARGRSFLDLTPEDGVFILAGVTGAPVEEVRAHCEHSGC